VGVTGVVVTAGSEGMSQVKRKVKEAIKKPQAIIPHAIFFMLRSVPSTQYSSFREHGSSSSMASYALIFIELHVNKMDVIISKALFMGHFRDCWIPLISFYISYRFIAN
jgi:hypothetical protein